MTRVEWSRLAGDDVEAAVAMFLSCDFPHAQRITPSRGDAGVDVLVVQEDRTAVYQVKSFAGPFTSSQKRKVKESMEALTVDPRVADLRVDEWHLVTPWDPTHEALTWLRGLAAQYGLPEPVWDGLTQCDRWAAAYPHVVDYYLHGNREHIERQVKGLLGALHIGSWTDDGPPADIDVQTLSHGVQKTVDFLNGNDPFYIYGLSINPVAPSVEVGREQTLEDLKTEFVQPSHPHMVMSQVTQHGSTRVRIDVYAKNAVALELRPITGSGVFKIPFGAEYETALRDFVTYGTPLDLPLGSYDGTTDAPGGLDGPFEDAAVVIGPLVDPAAPHQEVRLVVLDEHGDEVAVLPLHRVYSTSGIPDQDGVVAGVESVLRDTSETLTLRWRLTTATGNHETLFTFRPPCGKRPGDVLPALRTAAALRHPNAYNLAPAFGPRPTSGHPLPEDGLLRPALFWRDVTLALSSIQEHTATPLTVPSAKELLDGTAEGILQAGALLGGQTVEIKVPTLMSTATDDPTDPDPSGYCHLLMPLSVNLPEGTVTCGLVVVTFIPDGVETVDTPDGPRHQWTVRDGRAIARPHNSRAAQN